MRGAPGAPSFCHRLSQMTDSNALPAPASALLALLRGEHLEGADWDAVAVYAHATGLGPLLLQNAAEQLPSLQAARLRLTAQRTRTRNTALMAALADLLRASQAKKLSLIILKGAYLAPMVYRDLGLRGMTDIDVLVRPTDFPQWQAILTQLRYSGKHTDPEKGPGIVKHEWTYRAAGTAPATASSSTTNPYLFADDAFHLEPHTSLTESWFGLRLELGDGVWDRAIGWEWEGVPALALNPLDCLIHVAVHLIFHLLMGKPALLQLYDLRQLLETFPTLVSGDPTGSDVADRAGRAGAAAHVYAALRLAQTAYAAPVPAAWLQRLASAIPPHQRPRAEAVNLPILWRLTQQAPLVSLGQRLRRGLSDRALAAGWARDRNEAWRVWRSGLAFHRTDTAILLRQRLTLALR